MKTSKVSEKKTRTRSYLGRFQRPRKLAGTREGCPIMVVGEGEEWSGNGRIGESRRRIQWSTPRRRERPLRLRHLMRVSTQVALAAAAIVHRDQGVGNGRKLIDWNRTKRRGGLLLMGTSGADEGRCRWSDISRTCTRRSYPSSSISCKVVLRHISVGVVNPRVYWVHPKICHHSHFSPAWSQENPIRPSSLK